MSSAGRPAARRLTNTPLAGRIRTIRRRTEVLVDSTGKETWVPIEINKLTRTGRPGAYRWYQELTIASPTNDQHTPDCLQNRCLGDHDGCTTGGHPYRLPLVQTQADTDADFRRSEYARQLPPDTNGYARTFGRRPPAESDNSQRESRYTWKRIPAYGDDQQSMIMLLGSPLEKCVSRWHYRRLNTQQQAAA